MTDNRTVAILWLTRYIWALLSDPCTGVYTKNVRKALVICFSDVVVAEAGFKSTLPPHVTYWLSIAIFSNIAFLNQIWRRTGARHNILNPWLWTAYVAQFDYFKICKVYFWLMDPQCIEDFWAQINLYMSFNQHDFTATLRINVTSLNYFRNTISGIMLISL